MNVLELCLSPGLGGLELYVFRSSMALKARHDVTAVILKDGRLDQYMQKHSAITPLYIETGSKRFPVFRARKLARIIDQNKIDVIHMHWGKDLALAVFAKLLSKQKPAIVYTRQMMITRYKRDPYHRFLYRQVNLIITISRKLEALCRKYIDIKDRITTLYYGVNPPDTILDRAQINDIRHEKTFNEDDFVVGLFGRLEQGKGQHLLIEAIARARESGTEIKALIVGHEMRPGYQAELEQLARQLGVDSQLYFNGFTDRPQQLMQICDCLCLASYEETFGLVLPEAMRCGVAVIGSNSGGVPEIIDHNETGMLFESRNSNDLSRKIMELVQNPEHRKAIAQHGKDKADRMFDTANHFNTLANTMERLISGQVG